jgi:putative ABC transport system permease protein
VAAMVALANLLWRLAWQRRRELAILRSLGFGQSALSVYLLGQALSITSLGFGLGMAAALAFSALSQADTVGITLQAHFNAGVIAAGLGLALLISLAGSILPAMQLSRLNLASLLRDE